jgi:hypothetical protein
VNFYDDDDRHFLVSDADIIIMKMNAWMSHEAAPHCPQFSSTTHSSS